MTKKRFDELNYWQRLEAEETERERDEKRVNRLILIGYLGIVIVAILELF